MLMGKVISYFTPGTVMATKEARIYGGAMVTAIFIRLAFDHNYNYLTFMLGMRVRTACCSLVYRKVSAFKSVAMKLKSAKNSFQYPNVFPPPMPQTVLMNFVVFPPGCGYSVAHFLGWGAHEARLRCPDELSGVMCEDEVPGWALKSKSIDFSFMIP